MRRGRADLSTNDLYDNVVSSGFCDKKKHYLFIFSISISHYYFFPSSSIFIYIPINMIHRIEFFVVVLLCDDEEKRFTWFSL